MAAGKFEEVVLFACPPHAEQGLGKGRADVNREIGILVLDRGDVNDEIPGIGAAEGGCLDAWL